MSLSSSSHCLAIDNAFTRGTLYTDVPYEKDGFVIVLDEGLNLWANSAFLAAVTFWKQKRDYQRQFKNIRRGETFTAAICQGELWWQPDTLLNLRCYSTLTEGLRVWDSDSPIFACQDPLITLKNKNQGHAAVSTINSVRHSTRSSLFIYLTHTYVLDMYIII